MFATLGLPPAAWSIDGVEYGGGVGYLKAGLAFADADHHGFAQLRRRDSHGGGRHGPGRAAARARRPAGRYPERNRHRGWNPATDELLPVALRRRPPAGRAANKAALQARLGLDAEPGALLYGVVSRLTWQKGLDLLLEALPVLLGSGGATGPARHRRAGLQAGFTAAAHAHPGRVGCLIGYDEALAHLMQAGADALLVPSRFEPCGLTQLCAMRYGALPVVARVGGLTDTVVDANEMAVAAGVGSGVLFAPPSRDMLEAALLRTASLWSDRAAWRRVQRNGMRTDVSWKHPAARYATLFREVLAGRAS